ncbi:FecR family protein [Mucilaginibacter agri]|uniref:DUF4974 domain-containing protein n=1 Tax=Mucilaginibacter agri TaxID=2695265 RepID=A0A966DUA5_9SPHI|nr:FecR family protein [Mucilaginibacter agri]NCD71515.1 DUF4974 domain-containing protein [Mucilaginibacter agri]
MRRPLPVEVLEKYINGECTQAEIALVKQWYTSFENDHDDISDISPAEEKALEERMYQNILNNINTANGNNQPLIEPITRNSYKWYKLAGAAAVILIVGAFALLNYRTNRGKQSLDSAESQFVSITNNSGQLYKSILPDNSSVWLSPHAQLSFPKKFAKQSRMVSMKGECFFEVTKNPERPFIISSNSIVTKVWGTSFLVKDEVEGGAAAVSVLTGKVSVSVKSKKAASLKIEDGEVMLYPREKVTYLAASHALQPEPAHEEPELKIWTRMNLSFDNKPLSEIIPVLNSKFHVHIKTNSAKVNHYVLTADLAGFNLADVLEALKKSLNVNYQIRKDSIELV